MALLKKYLPKNIPVRSPVQTSIKGAIEKPVGKLKGVFSICVSVLSVFISRKKIGYTWTSAPTIRIP